jgi:hypothetical protein
MLFGPALLLAAAAASAGPSATNPSTVYSVDEDRDGRADRELVLEQSDALA